MKINKRNYFIHLFDLDNPVSAANYAGFQPANYIDQHLLDKWKSLRLAPSPRSTDAQFLRRLYLDAAGILPTPEEVEEFLASVEDLREGLWFDPEGFTEVLIDVF